MDTRVLIGGTSLVLLTGAAAAIQVTAPELLPVLCPLSLAVGSAAYLAARSAARTRIAGLLPAPRPYLLPASDASSAPPMDVAVQTQVLAALAEPPHPPAPLVPPHPVQEVPLLDTLLAAAPKPSPQTATLPLDYAPGMAERWMTSLLPLAVLETAVAYPDVTPRALAQRLHAMLVRGTLTVSRITLGCAMHEADQLGDWTAALVICDRAPDATLHERLLAHVAALAVQPYSRGGVALLAVLAQPATARSITVPSKRDHTAADRHGNGAKQPTGGTTAPARVREEQASPVISPKVERVDAATNSSSARTNPSPSSRDRDDTEPDKTSDDIAGTATVSVQTEETRDMGEIAHGSHQPDSSPMIQETKQPAPAPILPTPDHFVAHERHPQAGAPPPADLATARAIWKAGANLPQIHFGVHPTTGALITGPLEPTCFFVPTQRGKTTLLMYLLHQALLARDPQTGDGLATWFLTTKWQDTTSHGVQIGRWLRQAYNLAHFDAPYGIEPDGTGTYRMMLLLERELNARLTPGTTHPRTPVVAFLDEWAYTVAVLGQKRFKQEPRRTAKASSTPPPTTFDPLALEDATPKSPLEAASLAARRIIRQGFGERMVLFLATQDGQVQNNGEILNTGVLGSFSTYLCHTESDPQTFKIICKGDAARLDELNALRRQWQGWIYVREQTILPLTFPHVTNATIDAWLAELAAPAISPAPSTAAQTTPDAPAPSPHTADVTPEAWPEVVRAYITKLPPAQLQALTKAFARIGVTLPIRVGDSERQALLGLGDGDGANRHLLTLIIALATKAQPPMSLNQIAALVFGRTGQVSADIGRAVRMHTGKE